MSDENKCPHCGKPVPPTALGGICPECMLKAGLTAQTEGPGGIGPQGTRILQPPPSPADIAALFPQLEILECLGRGGMGVVYKARQPRLNRLVALKILAREKDEGGQFTERFTREAQALARLNHPNIVTVHDFGEAGGHCYLVMEFVDGMNLRQLLLTGKIPPEQALTIVPKICEALQYAHEQGIVHRDIKPENILLDKQGRVKIADFGIAKVLGAGTAEQQALTGARDVVGTPHYMAPEQLEKPLAVDHRADIYSLGVVFYEMLTGELPLGKFAPPSKKVQVDVRLDEVVLHTLEKEPERRYQQVNQLKTDVETISGRVPPAAGLAAKGGPVPLLATASDPTVSDKAIIPALLLAIFFGVFGAHRFYVGKFRTACLQLGLWCWCGLLIIGCATTGGNWEPTLGILLGFSMFGSVTWATIDWILILCKGFTDGRGKRIAHWVHPQNGGVPGRTNPPGGPPPVLPPGAAAPLPGPNPPPLGPAPEKIPGHGTGKIVAPAVGLMVGALWKLLSALSGLFFFSGGNPWLKPMLDEIGISHFSGMAMVGIVLFKVVPGLLILYGALQMLRLQSYAWAMASAVLSIVACSLIGLPMGIWALIVLLQTDVRETFARTTVASPARISPGIWLLAAVTCLAAIGVFSAILLVRDIAGKKSSFGGKPEVTAQANQPGDSVTADVAVPTPPATPEHAAPVPPPVRIRAGSTRPFTDSEGNVWLGDQGFADGETTERPDELAIVNTHDPKLYQAERYGMTSFSYPVPNGKYAVKLHFAETYEAITGPGKRVFTFIVEGHEFKDFDVWAAAGGAQRACVETAEVEVTDGKLNINFIPRQQEPEINGIEILPLPPTTPLPAPTSVPPLPPIPPAPPVPPAPPAPPAPVGSTLSASPTATATLSEPHRQTTKVMGGLLTKDAFAQNFDQTLPFAGDGRLSLDNVNGKVDISGWDRNEISISAVKHGKTPDSVEAVDIQVDTGADQVTVHTREPKNWLGVNKDSVNVDYTLRVPRQARLAGISSVNGQITIAGVSGDIAATTVNGRLQVQDAAGDLKLSTVNGQIDARLTALGHGQAVSLDTVNGRIDVTLPGDADATVTAATVNGGMTSDFPALAVKKEFPLGRNLKGSLGNGEARVKASTVNGSIDFQKGPEKK